MQFFKPENYFEVRKALIAAGRTELIGDGCDALIPSKPPPDALKARRERANREARGEYVHTIPSGNEKKAGYSPTARARREETGKVSPRTRLFSFPALKLRRNPRRGAGFIRTSRQQNQGGTSCSLEQRKPSP